MNELLSVHYVAALCQNDDFAFRLRNMILNAVWIIKWIVQTSLVYVKTSLRKEKRMQKMVKTIQMSVELGDAER